MRYRCTDSFERPGNYGAGQAERVEFPSSEELRELIRIRRERAADRPALEAFKRARLEAHWRLLARVERQPKAA